MKDQERRDSVNMVSDATINGTKNIPPVNMIKIGSSYIEELPSEILPPINGASILKTALNNSRGSSPQSISSSCSSTSDSTNFVNLTNGSHVKNLVKKPSSRRSSSSSVNSLDAEMVGSPRTNKKKATASATPSSNSSPISTPKNFVNLTNGSSVNGASSGRTSTVSSAPGTPDQNEKMDKGKKSINKDELKIALKTVKKQASNKRSSSVSSTDVDISGSPSLKKRKLNNSVLQDLSSSPSTPSASTPDNRADKRKRCDTCSACQVPACKNCWNCKNDKEQICVKRPKCELKKSKITSNSTPIKTPTNTPSGPALATTTNTASPSTTPKYDKRKRCGDCRTCEAPKCGTCSWCSKGTSGYCQKREKCERRPQHNSSTPTQLQQNTSTPKRQRCKSCSGCKATPCGTCAICVKKASAEAMGKKLGYGVCQMRKCLAMPPKNSPVKNGIPRTPLKKIKIKSKKCGKCDGCKAEPSGVCEDPIVEARNLSPEKIQRCGDCSGCVALECGSCTFCLKKAGGKITPGICTLKKCKKAKKIQHKKCGKCEGCLAESCGNCGHCNGKFPKKCFKKRCLTPIGVPSEGGKKKRCKDCPGCKAEECGECGHCMKKASLKPGEKMNGGICIRRKCENMTNVSAPKPKPIKKPKVSKPKGNASKSVKRTIRCGECTACVAPDCGHCESCKINEVGATTVGKISCLTNKCLHPKVLSGYTGRPSVQTPEVYVPSILCEDCPGCSTKCGKCPACLGLGVSDAGIPQKCTERICYNNRQRRKPTPKASTHNLSMKELMAKQDDSAGGTTIPIRIIKGVAYDFRCTFCKKLPRAGSANRSELMRHYSIEHYKDKLLAEFGHLRKCPHCNVEFKGKVDISHMGQKHNEVVKYLTDEQRNLCPLEIQGKSHNRRPRRMAVVKKRRRFGDLVEWPELPDGFHPAADNRLYDPDIANEPLKEVMMKEVTIIRINDKEIELGIDEEEECIEIGDASEIRDYNGVPGQCMICNTLVDEIPSLVLHLHEDHKIQGGPSHPMKDAQAFIERGFISVKEKESVKKLFKNNELISPKSVAKKSLCQTAKKSSSKPLPSYPEMEKTSPDQSPEPIRNHN